MNKKTITPFELKTATDGKPPVSSSVVLEELTEKLKGMRKFVVEHYNQMSATGAITVIDELENWIKKRS